MSRAATKKFDRLNLKENSSTTNDSKAARLKVGLVYDNEMTKYHHLWASEYPERPERLTAPLERCTYYKLLERCFIIPSRKGTKKEVLMKHSEEHYSLLKSSSQMNENELKCLSMKFSGVFYHPESYNAAMLSVGCAIEAMEHVLSGKVETAFALIRPPGHHAMKDEACGYCYFNNVALAASQALEKYKMKKILIIDWDVHHGQGTQFMFYDDPRVLFFSIHRYQHGSFWPNLRQSDYDFVGEGKGRGYNINIPLNETGMKDGDYMAIFQQILLPIAFEFQPELVLVSCGFDAVIGDCESKNFVTPACFAHLTHMVRQITEKTCFIFEGGYCLKSLSESLALTIRTLLGDPCPKLPPLTPPSQSTRMSILNSLRVLRPFWKCLKYQPDETINCSSEVDIITPKQGIEMADIVGPPEFYKVDEYEKNSAEEEEEYNKEIDLLIENTLLLSPLNRTCLAYDEGMLEHKQITGSHPERPDRIKHIKMKLEELGLWKRCQIVEKRNATMEELNLIHETSYIEKIKGYSFLNRKDLDIMTKSDEFVAHSIYACEATYECSTLAVGGFLNVVDEVLSGRSRNGFAIVRPPGHHAESNEANGFCFFNTVAIAAKYCQQKYNMKRVMILDWDVHHGNGTQQAFYSDPSVLTISIHRRDGGRFYPCGDENSSDWVGEGDGVGFNVNIPWPKGKQGDAEYMAVFQQIVMPIAYQFSPDVVLVSAGFDAAIGDPLGGCCITTEGFSHMAYMLSNLSNGRVMLVLEGGYNLNQISHGASACVSVLLGDPLPPIELNAVNERAVETINEVLDIQQKYWDCLAFRAHLPTRASTRQWLDKQMSEWEKVKYKKPIKVEYLKESTSDAFVASISDASAAMIETATKADDTTAQIREPAILTDNTKTQTSETAMQAIDTTKQVTEPTVQADDTTTEIIGTTMELVKQEMRLDIQSTTAISLQDVSKVDNNFMSPSPLSSLASSQLSLQSNDLSTLSSLSSSCNDVGPAAAAASTSAAATAQPAEYANVVVADDALVNLLSDLALGEDHLPMHAVQPLSWCPCLNLINPNPTQLHVDTRKPCLECGDDVENWMCLICFEVYCSRFRNSHMIKHTDVTQHPLVLSFSDLSTWCYRCDAYVDNQVLKPYKDAACSDKFHTHFP